MGGNGNFNRLSTSSSFVSSSLHTKRFALEGHVPLDAAGGGGKRKTRNRKPIVVCGLLLFLVVAGVVGFLVYWFAFRDKRSSSSGKGNLAVWGTNGSTVFLEDGSSFVYTNPHGGWWYYDVNDPFSNQAKAQSWTPGLNESFEYGKDLVRGVNVGGWLNTEPFISPALYQKYSSSTPRPVDEYTLSLAMAADTAGGGLNQLEDHYKTFITEKDFAEMAAGGINYVRIPIAFWAIEVREGEPFLPKVSWKYFLKAIAWARKYGIRINLDLHAVPGSQNGWNHSGRLGQASFLHGPMGYANAQRTLDYIRILAEFISQPQYRDVVTMFGILNEPRCEFQGKDQLSAFYAEAYRIVREVGGTGTGNGPWISIHECMIGKDQWSSFLPNADRLSLDSHPYMAFGDQSRTGWELRIPAVCQWGKEFNSSTDAFGHNNAGEWSFGINDCGLFLNGVEDGIRYEGTYQGSESKRVGSCDEWTDWERYNATTKAELRKFAMASIDALQNYFFWTWKIGPSLTSGKVETPAWSYQLGLENGWIPTDPREALGSCGNVSPWTPPLKIGNGRNVNLNAYPWPPSSIQNGGNRTALPSYTPTGAVPTLQGGTLTMTMTSGGVKATKSVDVGDGWESSSDMQGMNVPIEGCTYLDTWVGTSVSILPSPLSKG
ncbi:glycoside hydrolase [Marasmius fiardii PR-910]|nr:glycoside hydrolase [Marasmius fiardii PR-910]